MRGGMVKLTKQGPNPNADTDSLCDLCPVTRTQVNIFKLGPGTV